MNNQLGFFGADVFGRGFFGWASVGLRLAGSVTSQRLIANLTQETPNSQMIAGKLEIDGEDVSQYVESITARLSESLSTGTVDVVFIGDVSALVTTGDTAVLSFVFVLEDGTVYTNRAFRGVVKSVVPSEGSNTVSTQVAIWDENESKLSQAPTNTTWSGTAKDLIESELDAIGVDDFSLDFTDYSIDADVSSFSTVRDLIIAVANGKDECGIFTTQTGKLCVWSYSVARTVTQTVFVPRTPGPVTAHLLAAPKNASWDGSAQALIEDELDLAGSTLAVTMTDYTFTGSTASYATKRDLVKAVVNGSAGSVEFATSTGSESWTYSGGPFESLRSESWFPADAWVTSQVSVFTFPRSSYTYCQQIDNTRDRYRSYVVTGLTGTNAAATGTGSTDGGESSAFLSGLTDLQARANALVASLERPSLSFQVSLNPLVRVGDQISVERAAGVYSTCRVSSVTHTIEWSGKNSPGAWSNIVAEVMA